MSKAHHQGSAPSQRMLRVAELVRQAMSELLVRSDLREPFLEGRTITIPEVRMSPDLKLATIYVMPLGGKDMPQVLAALGRQRKHLRAEIAHRINLKFAPEIRFQADRRFDYDMKINELLDLPQVRRDLDRERDGRE
jgi:ribosome-binding factor A